MNTNLLYVAAVYGEGVYGACAYQDTAACNSTAVVGAPNTGFFLQPTFMIPAILGGAILIAAAILLVKKVIRSARG